jgi:hypothetical protein
MVPCTAETGSCSKKLIAYCKPQLRWLRCTLCLSEAHVQTLRLCTHKHFIDRLTPISTQHLRSLRICVFTPQNPSRSKGANRSSCLVMNVSSLVIPELQASWLMRRLQHLAAKMFFRLK